jgi:hypothetical protein
MGLDESKCYLRIGWYLRVLMIYLPITIWGLNIKGKSGMDFNFGYG